MDKEFQTWLQEHKEYCVMVNNFVNNLANDSIIESFNGEFIEWKNIDRKKDKSLSAQYFRFWLYLRLVDEHKYKES